MSGVPFLEMFPGCEVLRASCGGLDKALALQVLVNTAGSTQPALRSKLRSTPSL